MGLTSEKNMQLKHSCLLFLTSVIWGSGFVAQSVGMDYIGPFTFTAIRNFLGAIVLIPVVCWRWASFRKTAGDVEKNVGREGNRHEDIQVEPSIKMRKEIHDTLKGGVCCGIFLCIASNFQQFGIQYTSVGKAGFITALYVVFVPILGLFFKKKASIFVWIAVVLSVIGLYLLCMTETSFSLQFGDLLELICALMFSFHIIVIDHFTEKADSVTMSAIQFFVCGLLSMVLMFLFEAPEMSRILAAWQPILYAGFMASGMGYTLQVVGQQGVNPTVASLILCMESVVSALAGWMLLGQQLSSRELLGCVLMFGAIVLAQLPAPGTQSNPNES